MSDRERLFGYLEGARKIILVEPQALLTEASRMPGLDGRRCPSRTATRSACGKTPRRSRRRSARCRPTRARAPHRSGRSRQVPGVATAPVYTDEATHDWVQKAAARRVSAASTASSRSSKASCANSSRCSSAREVHGRPSLLRAIVATVATKRASTRRKRCATCVTRWACRTTDRPHERIRHCRRGRATSLRPSRRAGSRNGRLVSPGGAVLDVAAGGGAMQAGSRRMAIRSSHSTATGRTGRVAFDSGRRCP